jgi:hypothetical protein
MTVDAQALVDALVLVEQLRQENQALRAVITEPERRIADLAAENRAPRDQLEEAQRQAARQAASFRRRDSTKIPEAPRKRPGRPKGHPGVQRAVPAQVDEPVEVPLPAGPHCGGAVEGVEPIEPFIKHFLSDLRIPPALAMGRSKSATYGAQYSRSRIDEKPPFVYNRWHEDHLADTDPPRYRPDRSIEGDHGAV